MRWLLGLSWLTKWQMIVCSVLALITEINLAKAAVWTFCATVAALCEWYCRRDLTITRITEELRR